MKSRVSIEIDTSLTKAAMPLRTALSTSDVLSRGYCTWLTRAKRTGIRL